MKIEWSPTAIRDLNRIVGLIAMDKMEVALRWARTIEKKVARLKRFPKSGRIVPEVGRDEIRELVIGSYRIIYKLDKEISILTLFHGSKGSAGNLFL
ncbi:MAG: type II toxin-antitoxin system RelE/ParE family toxin [Deltaproteobacteria bacterium]|nr:type II toxin-antitoxin system RelE/ParE family toxin [Deltaproteobacteria bacterium]